jgi:hypothetical protein
MRNQQSNIRHEIAVLWRRTARGAFSDARRICGTRELNRRAAIAAADVRKLLPIHIALFEEALHALYTLSRVYSPTWWPKKTKERPLFWFFVNRQVALLAAIRRLALAGLSDSAYALTRAFLETSDVAIALAGDEDFRRLFAYWRRDFDENDFWKREIGYVRVQRRLRHLLEKLGLGTKDIDGWFRVRKLQNRRLSESVHPSSRSAMFNTVVPSLAYQGKFSADPIGHASAHTAIVLGVCTMETFHFVSVVIKLVLSRTSPMFPTHDSKGLTWFLCCGARSTGSGFEIRRSSYRYEEAP